MHIIDKKTKRMLDIYRLTALLFVLYTNVADAQAIKFSHITLQPIQVNMSIQTSNGRQVVRVTKDSGIKAVDQPTFVKLKDIDFKNGTIEVTVLSKLLPHAPSLARGFIGIVFRVAADDSTFECIYIRPTNGRADNQLQRNHSIQYFSYPDYDFERLRKEAPGAYESYADMGLNEWIRMTIVVDSAQAKLYLNNTKQPALVVNDLKHGAHSSGAIGLWVDVGTEGFFKDLRIYKK
jgi:hypothetical protein